MLAVTAVRTRIHSKPSRKTSTPMSSAATLKPKCGTRGSGLPAWLIACQIMMAVTDIPASHSTTKQATREAELELVMAL